MQVRFKHGFPIEDAGMLFEQVTISSNGKVIENIRNAQYVQHWVQNYMTSRDTKRKRKEEGFNMVEDITFQKINRDLPVAANNPDPARYVDHGYMTKPLSAFEDAGEGVAAGYGFDLGASVPETTRMDANLGYYYNMVGRGAEHAVSQDAGDDGWGAPMLMKFRIASSGLLNQDKMLPIMAMGLQI